MKWVTGGYLPRALAERVFQTGACPTGEDDPSPCFWALFDVLQFGCDAVRQPGDKIRGDITVRVATYAVRVQGIRVDRCSPKLVA